MLPKPRLAVTKKYSAILRHFILDATLVKIVNNSAVTLGAHIDFVGDYAGIEG
jgi:hypothetical protein